MYQKEGTALQMITFLTIGDDPISVVYESFYTPLTYPTVAVSLLRKSTLAGAGEVKVIPWNSKKL